MLKLPLTFQRAGLKLLDAHGRKIAQIWLAYHTSKEVEEYAAFIVKAANNHDALVRALRDIVGSRRGDHTAYDIATEALTSLQGEDQ